MAPLTALPANWSGPLLLLTWLAPLLGAALLALPAGRRWGLALAPLWGLPALTAALFLADGAVLRLPWMLTGTRLAMDPTGRVFLLLAAILWTAAAGFTRGYLGGKRGGHRFLGFYLVAMAGNLGLTVAQSPAGFLTFFALMGLSAYGLVIHAVTPFARRAANVYLGATAAGEVLVLAGLLLASSPGAGNGWAAPLLIAGLGLKAGMVPLHFWLPLAHPAAPAPASAVLSGSMINAGLLGWIRFLPLGGAPFPGLGDSMVALGLAGAFLAVVVGLAQRDPKTVLAYSSISQMGWMAVATGAGLAAPGAWPALLPAVLAYALHHGLAKGALFLSTAIPGLLRGRGPGKALLGAAAILPALAIAGLPGTSGGAAKTGLKEALTHGHGLDGAGFPLLLALGAVATTLLMVRFLVLLREAEGGADPGPPAMGWWLAVVGCSALLPWLWPPLVSWNLKGLSEADLSAGLWPVAAGGMLGLAWIPIARRLKPLRIPPLPAGDLYVGAEWAVLRLIRHFRSIRPVLARIWQPGNRLWEFVHAVLWTPVHVRLTAADRWGWATSGAVFLGILVALAWALFTSV